MLVSDSNFWFELSLYRLAIDMARLLDRYNAWSWCTCLRSMLVEFMLLGIAASSAAARGPSPKHVLVLTTAAIRSLFSNIIFPMTGASQGSIPFS